MADRTSPYVLDQLFQASELWGQASKNPTLRSTADRLRPPYPMPLPWLQPVNAPASRIYEVGFNRLPPGYRNLLREAPPGPPVSAGAMPTDHGWNVRGVYMRPPDLADSKLYQTFELPTPFTAAETPQTGAHELVHTLADRHPKVRALVPEDLEEVVARWAAENEFLPELGQTPAKIEAGSKIDKQLRELGDPTPPMYQRVMQYLFGRR